MKNQIYSTPKLCKSEKGWYVYFTYSGKQHRYKSGINYEKDLKKREAMAKALISALQTKLKRGWNPLLKEDFKTPEEFTFCESLDFALKKKKSTIAKKTYSGYKGTVNFLKEASEVLGITYMPVVELKRVHIRTLIEKATTIRKWSNKARNKHLNHLKALMSELVNWDILEYNPAHNIKNLPVSESRANTPATDKEHKAIKECLESKHPNFFNFVRTIYHAGIRPNEILQIKLSDIDFEARVFKLRAETTKTRKERIVPINNHLFEMLMFMELDIYPSDFYLFGSYREPGRGNVGKFIDFIPGPTRIKRDTATKKWNKIVKKGLKINVSMYSNKHKGADDKIKAGIELDVLRNLYGHSNKRMTEIYAKEVTNFYKNEIINKSPKF